MSRPADEAFPPSEDARFQPWTFTLAIDLWTGQQTVDGMAADVRDSFADGWSFAQGSS